MTESAQNREYPPGEDVFGAPWPEDPRLQEQQTLGEPETDSEPESETGPSGDPDPVAATPTPTRKDGDASGSEHEPARSAIKVTHTTRGTTWEVRVMAGDSEELLNATREIAVRQYHALERELG